MPGHAVTTTRGIDGHGLERMDCRRLTISEANLADTGFAWPEPLAFVDHDAALHHFSTPPLPAWPVVGTGTLRQAIAAGLDTAVEQGFSKEDIARTVIDQPRAAMVFVQLLRMLPSLPPETGLVAESLAYATLQASTSHRDWIARRPAPSRLLDPGTVALSREGDAVVATLDRPDAGNAIDRPMRDALHEAFALVNADPSIARFTLRASGKAFCLGADLDEFGTTTDPATAHAIRCRTLPAHEAVRCADRFVVEIDGACIGAGLELAAFASRITATRRSWFQLPELAMGIIPGAGGCVSLTRRIGRQRTALLALSGRRIGARQALDWGLIDALAD